MTRFHPDETARVVARVVRRELDGSMTVTTDTEYTFPCGEFIPWASDPEETGHDWRSCDELRAPGDFCGGCGNTGTAVITDRDVAQLDDSPIPF